MRLRWIPIILAIGLTLSILGGGNFFHQNRTDLLSVVRVDILEQFWYVETLRVSYWAPSDVVDEAIGK